MKTSAWSTHDYHYAGEAMTGLFVNYRCHRCNNQVEINRQGVFTYLPAPSCDPSMVSRHIVNGIACAWIYELEP